MNIDYLLNDVLNKALITNRIKGIPNSNKIAQFVIDYLEVNKQPLTKQTFDFDYIGTPFINKKGQRVAMHNTATIEAWDEEHATLLFKQMHPDTQFDPPY